MLLLVVCCSIRSRSLAMGFLCCLDRRAQGPKLDLLTVNVSRFVNVTKNETGLYGPSCHTTRNCGIQCSEF